jgi:hypothetical protein
MSEVSGVSEVFDDTHPRTPLFFLSYARPARPQGAGGTQAEPNMTVFKFFDDLSMNVALLVSRKAGADPGFIDQAIPAGRFWSKALQEALGTCQVFVALLSVPYLESTWCGKEWHAFSLRKVTPARPGASSNEAGIVPVIWAPIHEEQHPPIVRDIERFTPRGLPDPNIAFTYETEGVVGLLRMGMSDQYQAVVWKIARRIADICYDHNVEHKMTEYEDLRNVFRE